MKTKTVIDSLFRTENHSLNFIPLSSIMQMRSFGTFLGIIVMVGLGSTVWALRSPDSPGQALRESLVRRIYRYDGYSLANIRPRPGSSSGILDFPGKNYIGYFQYINQSSVIELHQGLWKHCQSDPGFATQCSGYSDSNLELVSTVLSVRRYNVDGLT